MSTKREVNLYDVIWITINAVFAIALIAGVVAYLYPYGGAGKLEGWERILATWQAWIWLIFH